MCRLSSYRAYIKPVPLFKKGSMPMSGPPPFTAPLRPSDLPAGAVHEFDLAPGADQRAAIAAELGLTALRKLRFAGRLAPMGRRDWRLTGQLGATVVQDCVVSFAPVTTRIDETVERLYLVEIPELPEGDEVEMPEDDRVEPLPAELDLGTVMIEALALALPEYPHAEGVTPLNQTYAAPGVTPMSDDDTKPFAGLAALKSKLESGNDEGEDA